MGEFLSGWIVSKLGQGVKSGWDFVGMFPCQNMDFGVSAEMESYAERVFHPFGERKLVCQTLICFHTSY